MTLSNSTFYYSIRLFDKILSPRKQETLIKDALLFNKLPYSMKIRFPVKIELESVNCIKFFRILPTIKSIKWDVFQISLRKWRELTCKDSKDDNECKSNLHDDDLVECVQLLQVFTCWIDVIVIDDFCGESPPFYMISWMTWTSMNVKIFSKNCLECLKIWK